MTRYLLLGGGVVLAAIAFFHPAPHAPAALSVSTAQPLPSPAFHRARPSAGEIVVYVAGAARRPGLYHLSSEARADDAVRRAGGFAQGADAAGVNLAQRLDDGDEVEVPVLGETPHRRKTRHPRKRRTSHRKRRRSADVVNLNTADAQQLEGIPGVGEAIAARIVAIREQEGPFSSLDELLDVAGMSEGRLERAREYLRL